MVNVFLIISIILIIMVALFITSNLIDNNTNSRISIQLVREEMRRINFGVTESIEAERRDMLLINEENVLFNTDKGEQERIKISNTDLSRIKRFITDSGLLYIERSKFESITSERFVRYTLTIDMNGINKQFQWTENDIEFDPGNVPPLLLRLKDMIYCASNKDEQYGISCS